MEMIAQQVFNGVVVGLFYALVALGYSMVYGIIKLINFAHGDIFMFGAFIAYLFLSMWRLGAISGILLIGAFLVSMFSTGCLGIGINTFAYRPLRNAPKIVLFITSLGVCLVLEYSVRLIWGPTFMAFPSSFGASSFEIGSIEITYIQVVLLAVCIAEFIAVRTLVQRTLIGKAMRAIALDYETSMLMGIDVDQVINLTFFIGASMAASAGIMYGLYYGQINFLMGFTVGLKAFIAVIIGGVGSLPGAMLGGMLLGMLETLGATFFGGHWKDVFAFLVLIAMLVFKPTGLMGERLGERM